MRILLIEPLSNGEQGGVEGRPPQPLRRSSFFLSLTLPYLTALTPPDNEVRIALQASENIGDELMGAYDLIGITCRTTQVRQALALARRARRLGRPVVIGGPATIEDGRRLAAVLARFATSVVIGEAEGLWPLVIQDVGAGQAKQFYTREAPAPLDGLPVPRFDLLNWDHFDRPIVLPCMASRGCPRRCGFCSEALYGGWRRRPNADVISELRAYQLRFGISRVAFRDDNFLADPKRSRDLLKGITPLGMEWSCQTDLNLARHMDLARIAVESGMRSISFGLESVETSNLRVIDKRLATLAEAETLFGYLQENGVETQVNIIFGFDHDTVEIFDRTVDFVLRNRVSLFFPSILYPIPGTPLFEQLLRENRIVEPHPPGIEDPLLVNFVPKNMTAGQLVAGYEHARSRFNAERRDAVFWLGEENNVWNTTAGAPAA